MKVLTHNLSLQEFEKAEPIYKIITHDINHSFFYFEIQNKRYYVAYFSPGVKVEFMFLEKENYLLVGVDLKAVVICVKTGMLLFSIGLFSFFKGFVNSNDLTFTILSESQDLVINKSGLSISQVLSHELEF
jgi:hypothetical protein